MIENRSTTKAESIQLFSSSLNVTLPASTELDAQGQPEPFKGKAAQQKLLEESQALGNKVTEQNKERINGFLENPKNNLDLQIFNFNLDATKTSEAIKFEANTDNKQVRTAVFLKAENSASPANIKLNNIDFASISGQANLTGGAGSQVVVADNAAQKIFLGADDDSLYGGGGNDTIGSSGGRDLIHGDRGHDKLRGGRGNDSLFGDQGHDRLKGEEGKDLLIGGKGNDTLLGSKGADLLTGNKGADMLKGDKGADMLIGSAGDDALFGGQGNDTMKGGPGQDIFHLSTGKDIIKDLSLKQGDTIIVPKSFNPVILQKGEDVIVRDNDNDLRTTFLDSTSNELMDIMITT